MQTLNVPQAAVAGIDHGGRRYLAKNGKVTVPDHAVPDLLRDGCFPVANKPASAAGRVCVKCGFNGYFRICGRCGGTCEPPQPKEK
jgi:hypothetical protein